MSEDNQLIEWNLLHGSHDFPGPDGGTCINEAAVVARGFKYKSIGSAGDLPPCFSKVVGQLALCINDELDDGQRNKYLKPFICRLPGTRDIPTVERARAFYVLDKLCSVEEENYNNYTVNDINDKIDELNCYRTRATDMVMSDYVKVVRQLCNRTYPYLKYLDNNVDMENVKIPWRLIADNSIDIEIWVRDNGPEEAVKLLDHVINMGKHETMANIEIINERMRSYKENGKHLKI